MAGQQGHLDVGPGLCEGLGPRGHRERARGEAVEQRNGGGAVTAGQNAVRGAAQGHRPLQGIHHASLAAMAAPYS
ncbi:hypothetical protein ACFFX0_06320 [Citricoccus parietis]|uniref:Uncharacterized protein n=1 Tax=Citricoccus parietis TaxID=592307 RepID=A0ABV5FVY4_9MICC